MVNNSCCLLDDIKERYSSINMLYHKNHTNDNNLDLNLYAKHIPIDKITDHISLLDRLKEKYNADLISGKPKCTDILIFKEDNSITELLRFDGSEDDNCQKLFFICSNAKELRKQYADVLSNSDENAIYFKTVNSFIFKIERLIDRGIFSPNKISNEIVKILSSTIMKNFAKKELHSIIDDFMLKCKFDKKELKIGQSIEDEDLDYIGDNYLKVEVSSPEMHNTIINKSHDAYIFDCYDPDEEEFFKKIIPGDYAIGYRKE